MKDSYIPLVAILVIAFAIWGWSSRQVLKYTTLKSNARYVHAIGLFPLLLGLVIGSIVLGGALAPELLEWVGEVASYKWPFHLEALLVFPVVAPIPLLGFYIWWKLVKKLERVLGS